MLQAGQLLRGKFKNAPEPGPTATRRGSEPPAPSPSGQLQPPRTPPLRGRPRRAAAAELRPGPRAPARQVCGRSRQGRAGRCGGSGRRDAGLLRRCPGRLGGQRARFPGFPWAHSDHRLLLLNAARLLLWEFQSSPEVERSPAGPGAPSTDIPAARRARSPLMLPPSELRSLSEPFSVCLFPP